MPDQHDAPTAAADGALLDRHRRALQRSATVRSRHDVPVASRPFLSVITRTTGERETLLDTLLCLAAQTDDDFEVLLMVNARDAGVPAEIAALVDTFAPSFRARVRVDSTSIMHRVAPLNRALAAATGRYVAVLDDDDLVFADWVETFHRHADEHPGAMIRCRAVDQSVELADGTGVAGATSGFSAPYRPTFEFASHLIGGQSPPATFCSPLDVIDALGLRFDEDMVVCEDIEFFLRLATVCGVVDTSTFGMVYRRWETRFSSGHTVSPEIWEASMQKIVQHLDDVPLLLPEHSATRMYQAAAQERQMYELDAVIEALRDRLAPTEFDWSSPADAVRYLDQEYLAVVADRDHRRHVVEEAAAHPFRELRRWAVACVRHLLK